MTKQSSTIDVLDLGSSLQADENFNPADLQEKQAYDVPPVVEIRFETEGEEKRFHFTGFTDIHNTGRPTAIFIGSDNKYYKTSNFEILNALKFVPPKTNVALTCTGFEQQGRFINSNVKLQILR